MSDEPKKRRWWSRAWTWWTAIVLVFVLLVLYPASFPLVVRRGNGHGYGDEAVAFYHPVDWVTEHSDTCSQVWWWYLGLWGIDYRWL